VTKEKRVSKEDETQFTTPKKLVLLSFMFESSTCIVMSLYLASFLDHLVLMIIGIKQQYIYFTSYPSLGRGANL
jgi:hypothetical protein